MKGFLITWLIAFGVVTLIASGVTYYIAKQPEPAASRAGNPVGETDESAPFTEAEAVQVVARRLPSTAGGDQLRRALQGSATVTYHSPQHWRVCYDGACWVAHGPGRYAEPENDAARQREAGSVAPR